MERNWHRLAILLVLGAILILTPFLPACAAKTTQPATEQPPGALSFEAEEYTNTEYGFSIKYPKEWQVQPSDQPTTIFYAASAKRVPLVNVFVVPGADITEAFTAAISGSGSDVQLVSQKQTTLQDGTPAIEASFKWKGQGVGVNTLALGVNKKDKWIIVAVTTAPLLARYDEALFSEIIYTLRFSKR